jgi:hypothetical protein
MTPAASADQGGIPQWEISVEDRECGIIGPPLCVPAIVVLKSDLEASQQRAERAVADWRQALMERDEALLRRHKGMGEYDALRRDDFGAQGDPLTPPPDDGGWT